MTNSPDAAFNAALILLENEYPDGIYYMEQASARGNSAASLTLCGLYANELSSEFGKFNPNQALEYCILSYRQAYSPGAVDTSNQVYNNTRSVPKLNSKAKITLIKLTTCIASNMVTGDSSGARDCDNTSVIFQYVGLLSFIVCSCSFVSLDVKISDGGGRRCGRAKAAGSSACDRAN